MTTHTLHVVVDTDELRKWAEKHADSGHAGVAHALYRAAERYDDQIDALDRVRRLAAALDEMAGERNWKAALLGPTYRVIAKQIRAALDGGA